MQRTRNQSSPTQIPYVPKSIVFQVLLILKYHQWIHIHASRKADSWAQIHGVHLSYRRTKTRRRFQTLKGLNIYKVQSKEEKRHVWIWMTAWFLQSRVCCSPPHWPDAALPSCREGPLLDAAVPTHVHRPSLFSISNNPQTYSDYSHILNLESLKKQRANTCPLN